MHEIYKSLNHWQNFGIEIAILVVAYILVPLSKEKYSDAVRERKDLITLILVIIAAIHSWLRPDPPVPDRFQSDIKMEQAVKKAIERQRQHDSIVHIDSLKRP